MDPNDPNLMIQALAKPGQTIPQQNIMAGMTALPGQVASGVGNMLGINDAVRALRGEMTPDEAQMFALGAAPMLVGGPEAKIEEAVVSRFPKTFWRGTVPEETRRISTGIPNWDNNLFMSSNKDSASMYGPNLTQYDAAPDAKILYEGTRDFVNTAGKWRQGESLLDYSARAAEAARQAGYDAVHFKRQGDVGTVVFNPDKFLKQEQSNSTLPQGR